MQLNTSTFLYVVSFGSIYLAYVLYLVTCPFLFFLLFLVRRLEAELEAVSSDQYDEPKLLELLQQLSR